MTTLYCARAVVPIAAAIIEDGAIAVAGDRILKLGRRSELTAEFPNARHDDLGAVAILPGLVNTHSHLELTAMRGYLEAEESDFFAWLRKLTVARLERMTPDDLLVSASWGACEAARSGVTCFGDASDAAEQSMKALQDVGLRGTVYQESFGPDHRLARENFTKLQEKVARLREIETPLVRAGVSPHSPYTVCADQLELIAEFARAEKLPLMIHAAESAAEDLLLREGRGPFAEGMVRRNIEWPTAGVSPIKHLERHGILDTNPLLAHCIRVDEADLDTVKHHGAAIAHCPRSNAKLGHGRAPFARFLQAKIAVGLGSDSVASNNDCDLLQEARFAVLTARAAGEGAAISAAETLRVATAGGARALGAAEQFGLLAPGLAADFIAVSLDGVHQIPGYDVPATLIFASSGRDVRLTVVAGREIYRDGAVKTVDEERLRARLKEIATKLGAGGGAAEAVLQRMRNQPDAATTFKESS